MRFPNKTLYWHTISHLSSSMLCKCSNQAMLSTSLLSLQSRRGADVLGGQVLKKYVGRQAVIIFPLTFYYSTLRTNDSYNWHLHGNLAFALFFLSIPYAFMKCTSKHCTPKIQWHKKQWLILFKRLQHAEGKKTNWSASQKSRNIITI